MFFVFRLEEDKKELGWEEGEGDMLLLNIISKELVKKLNVFCLWNYFRIRLSFIIIVFIIFF